VAVVQEKLETNGFKVLWEVNIPDDGRTERQGPDEHILSDTFM